MDVLLKNYFWVVNLLVIALCASLGGRAAAHLVEQKFLLGGEAAPRRFTPPPIDRQRGKDTEGITKRNVFCSACAPIVEKTGDQPPPPPPADNPVKSSLPFELVSTMWVPKTPQWSMAVIRDTGSKEKEALLYNEGKTLPNTSATIVRVDPRRVYLKNNGGYEYLEIEGSDLGRKKEEPASAAVPAVAMNTPGMDPIDSEVQKSVRCNGSSCEVDRPLVDKLLANTTSLATAARFVPSVKDGHPNGFKLYAIRPSSIFGKIGLQNGDTIKAINGMEMSSPDQALAVYSKLRAASHLSVMVERRGETITLDYSIR